MKTIIIVVLTIFLASCTSKYNTSVLNERTPAFRGISDPSQIGLDKYRLLEQTDSEGLSWPLLSDSKGNRCNIKNIIERKINNIDLVKGDSGKTTKDLSVEDYWYSYVADSDSFIFFISAGIKDKSSSTKQKINLLLTAKNDCRKTKIVDHGKVFDLYFKTAAFKDDLSKTITLVNFEKNKFGITFVARGTQTSPETYIINLSNHKLERIIDFTVF